MISTEGQVQKFLFRVRTPAHSKRCRIVLGSHSRVNPSPCALLRKSLQNFSYGTLRNFSFAWPAARLKMCRFARAVHQTCRRKFRDKKTESFNGKDEGGIGAETGSGF